MLVVDHCAVMDEIEGSEKFMWSLRELISKGEILHLPVSFGFGGALRIEDCGIT